MLEQLFEALNSINWTKGKGDITAITIKSYHQHGQQFQGTVHRRLTSITDTRSFTLNGNVVKFLGRQRTIKTPD
jgi:hypothetical protein